MKMIFRSEIELIDSKLELVTAKISTLVNSKHQGIIK